MHRFSFYSTVRSCFIILLQAIFLASCSSEVNKSKEQAATNRGELESIIKHYASDSDSRKLEAAQFLIRNLQYHSTTASNEVKRYYDQMDSISQLTPTRWSISPEQDSLFNTLENQFDKIQGVKMYDSQVIKADELIRHIDNMVALYDSAVWCKGVDFETFCEYLLPYRVAPILGQRTLAHHRRTIWR